MKFFLPFSSKKNLTSLHLFWALYYQILILKVRLFPLCRTFGKWHQTLMYTDKMSLSYRKVYPRVTYPGVHSDLRQSYRVYHYRGVSPLLALLRSQGGDTPLQTPYINFFPVYIIPPISVKYIVHLKFQKPNFKWQE